MRKGLRRKQGLLSQALKGGNRMGSLAVNFGNELFSNRGASLNRFVGFSEQV
jgi:hypothetical protein